MGKSVIRNTSIPVAQAEPIKKPKQTPVMKKLRNSLSSLATPAVVAVAILFSVCSAQAEWQFVGGGASANSGNPSGPWQAVNASGSTFYFNKFQDSVTQYTTDGVLYRDSSWTGSLSIVLQAKAVGDTTVTLAEGDSIASATDHLTITLPDSTTIDTQTFDLHVSSISGSDDAKIFTTQFLFGGSNISLTPDVPGYLSFAVDPSIYEGTGQFSISVADNIVVTTALGATVDLGTLATDVSLGTNDSGGFETDKWVEEVPEPGTVSLMLLGMGGVILHRRWSAKKH